MLSLPVQHIQIAQGDQGIYQTCYRMRQYISVSQSLPQIRELTQTILQNCQQCSKAEKSKMLAYWVAENIRYTPDDDMSYTERGLQWMHINQCPNHFQKCEPVEMLYTPIQTLHQRYGDCDDQSTLLGSMLESIGIPVRITVAAADPSQPGEFSHVYLLAGVDGKWIPIDTVNREKPWGWQIEKPFRREVVC